MPIKIENGAKSALVAALHETANQIAEGSVVINSYNIGSHGVGETSLQVHTSPAPAEDAEGSDA